MIKLPPIVLIVHPGTLGDVLLSVEAIRQTREIFPSHHVVWVGRSEVGDLLLRSGEVHEVIGIESSFLSPLFTIDGKFDNRLARYLERTTHCVCWMTNHEETISSNLQPFGIRCIIQSPHSPKLPGVHQEEKFSNTLRPWGVSPEASRRRKKPLYLNNVLAGSESESLDQGFQFINTSYFVIHPGSGSKHKCVNPALLGGIAKRVLENSGMSLVLLSGPADEVQVNHLLEQIPCGGFHLVRNQSLPTVAEVLKRAALYIGHDSGVSHLAAMVGTPSIVLFGPTNPTNWAPRGDHVTVIPGPPCQCEDWSQVHQCQTKSCLDIPAHSVLHKVEEKLLAKRKFQISDFKSQMGSHNRNPKFQISGSLSSYP